MMSRRGLLALMIASVILPGIHTTPVEAVGSGLMDKFIDRQAEKQRAKKERIEKKKAEQKGDQKEEKKSGE